MFEARHSGIFDRNHPYPTRGQDDLLPFNARLTITENSLRTIGPNTWNSIPQEIKNSPTLSIFKNRYKHYLLSTYEGWNAGVVQVITVLRLPGCNSFLKPCLPQKNIVSHYLLLFSAIQWYLLSFDISTFIECIYLIWILSFFGAP